MTGGRVTFVFDTGVLFHPVLIERLDVLGWLVEDARCVTTRVVLDELERRAREDGTRGAPPRGSAGLKKGVSFSQWAYQAGVPPEAPTRIRSLG